MRFPWASEEIITPLRMKTPVLLMKRQMEITQAETKQRDREEMKVVHC